MTVIRTIQEKADDSRFRILNLSRDYLIPFLAQIYIFFNQFQNSRPIKLSICDGIGLNFVVLLYVGDMEETYLKVLL